MCAASQAELAVAIEVELAQLPGLGDPVARAQARLRAVGTGYVRFAQDEPGLFRTAFWAPADLTQAGDPARAGRSGLTPYQHMSAALDDLAAAGALPADRRPGAEFLAWSAVHGLALLLIDGPLRILDEAGVAGIRRRLLDMVEQGL